MSAPSPEAHSLAGAYALDALPAADSAEFEQHLAGCPTCAGEVREFQATAAALATAVAADPPAALRGRVLDALAGTPQEPPRPAHAAVPLQRRARRSQPSPWPVRLLAAAAVVFAALAGTFGVGAYRAQQDADQVAAAGAQVARVLTAPDATVITKDVQDGGRATVIASSDRGQLAVVADGLPRLPAAQTYQLWYIDAQQRATSVGLAQPQDGRLSAVIPRAYPPGSTFGLSVEPAGGSPRPTQIKVEATIPS